MNTHFYASKNMNLLRDREDWEKEFPNKKELQEILTTYCSNCGIFDKPVGTYKCKK